MEMFMKACVFNRFGGPEELHIRKNIPEPKPKDDEVQVRLRYAGVNPIDWKVRQGYLKDMAPHNFPVIPGWDGSGIVTALGSHVRHLKIGDEVFGRFRTDEIKWGTYAEYSVSQEKYVAIKPKEITFKEAAALPIPGLTAWQALFEFAKLQPKQTVVIYAAAGGVGGMAVQLAHYKGAKVIGIASKQNHEYVFSQGATHVIDYTKENAVKKVLEFEPKGVDVVFDCVGGKACEESLPFIKTGGCLVSIANFEVEKFSSPKLRAGSISAYPNADQLKEIALLLVEKKIKAPEITEFELDEAKNAQELSQTGHVRGKIVLKC
jgi:NADPH:quinone reductase-like Zn-dependent oxidoreductase